jgi:hypothetical protein
VTTTITGNSAASGGGVYLREGKWMMAASTLSANAATVHGGGIAAVADNDVNLANCTLSGNSADHHGGGIFAAQPQTWELTNVTLTENAADHDRDGIGKGGGIFVGADTGPFTLHNTIVAGNKVAGVDRDVDGPFDPSSSSNLIGMTGIVSGLTDGSAGNQVGSPGDPRDARLAPLANHGGYTLTHALLPGSPAIDAGNNARASEETSGRDQRDELRNVDGNLDGTATVDIGAYELTHADKIGVYRERDFSLLANGRQVWTRSRYQPDVTLRFGRVGSSPLSGDFNGDGLDEIAAHFGKTFCLDMNGNGTWDGVAGGDAKLRFGMRGSMPLAGDFNGDGVDEIGAYHAGRFYIDANGNGRWDGRAGGDLNLEFGPAEATPLAGDWDGDGVDEIGAHFGRQFRLDANGNGRWDGQAGGDLDYAFGAADDSPLAGDFNGDGIDEIGAHRNHKFFLDTNGNGNWDTSEGGDAVREFEPQGTPLSGNWRPAGLPLNQPYNGDARPVLVVLPDDTIPLPGRGPGPIFDSQSQVPTADLGDYRWRDDGKVPWLRVTNEVVIQRLD